MAIQPKLKKSVCAEEGIPVRAIAETTGQRLELPVESIAPEEAQAVFGRLAMFAGQDTSASSEQTRDKLEWQPQGPGLIADLEQLRTR